jgi:hypothetical protein
MKLLVNQGVYGKANLSPYERFSPLSNGSPSHSECAPETIYVQIYAAKLRKSPQQWAPGVGELAFGNKLTVISHEGSWFKVLSIDGQEGYVHESAVTLKRVVLKSAQTSLADAAVDESQVYLAGKGFNDEVERGFRSDNAKDDYDSVDKMQAKEPPSDETMLTFLKDGNLKEAP